MKLSIVLLAVAALVAAIHAAPSTEIEENSHVATDTTSALIASNGAGEENTRTKKSPAPKTICNGEQGSSNLQCAESLDSELAGSSAYPTYSAAPSSSYGSAPSYSAPAPSYKVSGRSSTSHIEFFFQINRYSNF